jgi:hypothetical protein
MWVAFFLKGYREVGRGVLTAPVSKFSRDAARWGHRAQPLSPREHPTDLPTIQVAGLSGEPAREFLFFRIAYLNL